MHGTRTSKISSYYCFYNHASAVFTLLGPSVLWNPFPPYLHGIKLALVHYMWLLPYRILLLLFSYGPCFVPSGILLLHFYIAFSVVPWKITFCCFYIACSSFLKKSFFCSFVYCMGLVPFRILLLLISHCMWLVLRRILILPFLHRLSVTFCSVQNHLLPF